MTDRNHTTRKYPRTLQEAFPRNPEWRDAGKDIEDGDYMVTIFGIVCIGFVLILAWLGY